MGDLPEAMTRLSVASWAAEDVRFLDKAVKAGRANARILQWAGHVNEYSRAAGPNLPKDAHVNIWGYALNATT